MIVPERSHGIIISRYHSADSAKGTYRVISNRCDTSTRLRNAHWLMIIFVTRLLEEQRRRHVQNDDSINVF